MLKVGQICFLAFRWGCGDSGGQQEAYCLRVVDGALTGATKGWDLWQGLSLQIHGAPTPFGTVSYQTTRFARPFLHLFGNWMDENVLQIAAYSRTAVFCKNLSLQTDQVHQKDTQGYLLYTLKRNMPIRSC